MKSSRRPERDVDHSLTPNAKAWNWQGYISSCGPGSSVGIATELRAGRSGIESGWRRDFPPVQTGLGAHPASCKMGTGSFPGVKCGWGVLLITHPLLVPRSWKSRAIPLPTLWATPGLWRDHFTIYLVTLCSCRGMLCGDFHLYLKLWISSLCDYPSCKFFEFHLFLPATEF